MINTLIGRFPPLVMKTMKAIVAECVHTENTMKSGNIDNVRGRFSEKCYVHNPAFFPIFRAPGALGVSYWTRLSFQEKFYITFCPIPGVI